jgi:transposase
MVFMARYKNNDQNQGEFIVVNFKDQLLPGTFEHALNYLIDSRIDLSLFDSKYKNDQTGAKAIDPRILLKIALYSYSRGVFTSRKMEHLCETNIIAKALSANTVPHFTVIADFISSMTKEISDIFVKVLMVCQDMGLIGGELFAIDGCKLPSNASKESSGTFIELRKKKDKMEKLVRTLIEKHSRMDADASDGEYESGRKQKTIDKLNDRINRIQEFLDTQNPKMGSRGKEIQSNITDNESAKIKCSHGVIQGYNGIAMVDAKNQVVVAAEPFGLNQEHSTFIPILAQAEKNLTAVTDNDSPLEGKTVLADTGYFCETNLKTAAEKKIESIIPDPNFRKRDERFSGRERLTGRIEKFGQHDFVYNQDHNTYTCPNGKILKYRGHATLHGNSGHRYQSKASDCKACPFTDRCFQRKKSKRGVRNLYIVDSKGPVNYSRLMIEKIDRPEIRDLYSKRMGIIEPVFAHITFQKGLNRFTLRTKDKVNIQWLLYCIVHNIAKITGSCWMSYA